MQIQDSKGKTFMERRLVVIRKGDPESLSAKWYVYFLRPPDVRRLVFMVWKYPDRDDDRWLYLPALDLVKRLAGSDTRSSFGGSHFVYEDIVGRYPRADRHELVNTTEQYYEVKSIPKDQSQVEFSYFYTWIDRETFIPAKRVFYDHEGEKHREFRAASVETIEGFPTIVQFVMSNLHTGGRTIAN